MNLTLTELPGPPTAERAVEVVERKGLGHPDTLSDAFAEAASGALSRFYLDRFGMILHHNVDKVLLWGGSARADFGGGEVLAPIEVFIAGRAIREYQGVTVPIDDLITDSCRAYVREKLRNLDPDRHVKLHCLVRPGSADLVELYSRQRATGAFLANDTSIGVGFAPATPLETLVHRIEGELNASATKDARPELGEDVKVMGVRAGRHLELTVACAFVARHVRDLADYLAKKERVATRVRSLAADSGFADAAVAVNVADDPTSGSVYLTATGLSAEAGDDGQAGRGNRVGGLITPGRPMTMESAAGKNPITHVGKLYNIAARLIADAIAALPDVAEAECTLVSRIGRPIAEPQIAETRIKTVDGRPVAELRPQIEAIMHRELSSLDGLWRRLLAGELTVY